MTHVQYIQSDIPQTWCKLLMLQAWCKFVVKLRQDRWLYHVASSLWKSNLIQFHFCRLAASTRVKTHKLLQVCKQVVTSLFTRCQQVVFALFVPSLLQQIWNKLLTTCNKLDGIIRLVTRLFLQVCYSHDTTKMLQGWRVFTRKNLTTCSKSANKPSTSCVRTACYKLSTSLETSC